MQTEIALAVVVIAGVMQGNWPLPMKFTKRWPWENMWIAFNLFALLLIPIAITALAVPRFWQIYFQGPMGVLAPAIFFGAMWGVGNVFCGLGVAAVGIALGMSIVIGLATALGVLLPLFILHRSMLGTPPANWILLGVAVMCVGVVVCAVAGYRRECCLRLDTRTSPSQLKPWKGILFCILSGVASPCLNFAFAFSGSLVSQAKEAGASLVTGPMVVWVLTMLGSLVVNLSYAGSLIKRNKSLANFSASGTRVYWLWTFLMGVLLTGGIFLYGAGAVSLGPLGASVGWGIFLSFTIIAANISGFLTGEWRGVPSRFKVLMLAGIVLLIVATGITAYANSLL